MSDEINSPNLNALAKKTDMLQKHILRFVWRDPQDKLYYVIERTATPSWKKVSKGYPHSTSCFAKLGRLTQNDALSQTWRDVDGQQILDRIFNKIKEIKQHEHHAL